MTGKWAETSFPGTRKEHDMLPQKAKKTTTGTQTVREICQMTCFKCHGQGTIELDPPGSGAMKCTRCLGSGKVPGQRAYDREV